MVAVEQVFLEVLVDNREKVDHGEPPREQDEGHSRGHSDPQKLENFDMEFVLQYQQFNVDAQ